MRLLNVQWAAVGIAPLHRSRPVEAATRCRSVSRLGNSACATGSLRPRRHLAPWKDSRKVRTPRPLSARARLMISSPAGTGVRRICQDQQMVDLVQLAYGSDPTGRANLEMVQLRHALVGLRLLHRCVDHRVFDDRLRTDTGSGNCQSFLRRSLAQLIAGLRFHRSLSRRPSHRRQLQVWCDLPHRLPRLSAHFFWRVRFPVPRLASMRYWSRLGRRAAVPRRRIYERHDQVYLRQWVVQHSEHYPAQI